MHVNNRKEEKMYLEKINQPADVRNLNKEQLEALAQKCEQHY